MNDELARNKYERLEDNADWCGELSDITQAMVECRSSYVCTDSQACCRTIGLEVVGPLLVSFAWQLYQLKNRKHFDAIYCLARDGQVIKHVLDRMSEFGIDYPPVVYLPVSRHALRIPESALSTDLPIWIFEESANLTLQTVFSRLGLNIDLWIEWLAERGWSEQRLKKRVPDWKKPQIKKWLTHGKLGTRFREYAQSQLRLVTKLFETEGLSGNKSALVVDVGWRGTLQRSMEHICASNSFDVEIYGYYLGFKQSLSSLDSDCYDSFLKESEVANSGMTMLLELFLSADHGGVLGYRESKDQIEAVLSSAENKVAIDNGLFELRRGVDDFLDILGLTLHSDKNNQNLDGLKPFAVRNLFLFTETPSRNEAIVFGKWPLSIDATHGYESVLAPDMSFLSVANEVFQKRRHKAFWIQGIRKNSGFFVSIGFVVAFRIRAIGTNSIKYTKVLVRKVLGSFRVKK